MIDDLIAMRERPPRIEARYPPWGRLLCMGLLIDWLDSRPEHARRNDRALTRRASATDMVAFVAAVVTGRIDEEWPEFAGPIDHRTDYGVAYHAQIAGHLQADELAFGEVTYRRLHDVAPECVSAAVNLAEIERRCGRERDAERLLQDALERARSTSMRYGVADSKWSVEVRCALARLARNVGDGGDLLACADRDRIGELVSQLEAYRSWERAALPAHEAFSVASTEQRIVLHAAMDLASIWPKPPPAAHDRFEALAAVDDLVGQHRPTSPPQAAPVRPPGLLGSAILKILQRLRPK